MKRQEIHHQKNFNKNSKNKTKKQAKKRKNKLSSSSSSSSSSSYSFSESESKSKESQKSDENYDNNDENLSFDGTFDEITTKKINDKNFDINNMKPNNEDDFLYKRDEKDLETKKIKETIYKNFSSVANDISLDLKILRSTRIF